MHTYTCTHTCMHIHTTHTCMTYKFVNAVVMICCPECRELLVKCPTYRSKRYVQLFFIVSRIEDHVCSGTHTYTHTHTHTLPPPPPPPPPPHTHTHREWSDALQEAMETTGKVWVEEKRFGSFAPVRENSIVKW